MCGVQSCGGTEWGYRPAEVCWAGEPEITGGETRTTPLNFQGRFDAQ